MKKYSLMILISSLLITNLSCGNSLQTQNFVINGKIINQKNGRLILSFDKGNETFIKDTVNIKNGNFSFRGNIKQPTMVSLRGNVKNFADDDINVVSFFIEPNKPATITIEKDKFKEAKIFGSITQIEFEKYNLDTKDLELDDLLKYNYQYIQKNTSSYVSVFMLNIFKQFWSVDSALMLYNNLKIPIQKSIIGREVIEKLNSIKNSEQGNQPYLFVNEDIKGRKIALEDLKDKIILLDFWASWCIPCRKNNPTLLQLYNKYHIKGLEVIAISSDENIINWRKAITKDGTSNFIQMLSNSYKSGKLNMNAINIGSFYGIEVLPTHFLIGRDGKIIERFKNENDLTKLKEKLIEVFGF